MASKSNKPNSKSDPHDYIARIEEQIEPWVRAYCEKNKIDPNDPPGRQLFDHEVEALARCYRKGLFKLKGRMKEIDRIRLMIDLLDDFVPFLPSTPSAQAEIIALAEQLEASEKKIIKQYAYIIRDLIQEPEKKQNISLLAAVSDQMKRNLL